MRQPLESDKHVSLWPLALGILAAVSWFRSKSRTPIQQSVNANRQNDDTEDKRNACQNKSAKPLRVTIESLRPREPADQKREAREKRKEWQGWGNVGLSVLTLSALVAYACITHKQLKQMIAANELTQSSLNITQGANITVGRKDGVLAEFSIPKDSKTDAGITIYFQNNGRSPATFNWGLLMDISTLVYPVRYPAKPNSGFFTLKSPYNWDPWVRTRNRKNGTIKVSGGDAEMIGGESLYVSEVAEISQDQIRRLNNGQRTDGTHLLLQMEGGFQSCDALGNYVCRRFSLYYQGSPYNRWIMGREIDCPSYITTKSVEPNLEHLTPCETPAEREKAKR